MSNANRTNPDIFGSCQGCEREFTTAVTDRTRQCIHERDGLCQGCRRWELRNHADISTRRRDDPFPPGIYSRNCLPLDVVRFRLELFNIARRQRIAKQSRERTPIA